ncbi:hypothetical protein JCM11641_002608 [Rhodosporidiobolus odoratus]
MSSSRLSATSAPSSRRQAYQPFPHPTTSSSSTTTPHLGPASTDSLLRVRHSSSTRVPSSSHRDRDLDRESHARASNLCSNDTASESGLSAFSSFAPVETQEQRRQRRQSRRAERDKRRSAAGGKQQEGDGRGEGIHAGSRDDSTDSPLRSWARWITEQEKLKPYAMVLAVVIVVLVKWCVGLGGYSGYATPPLRGDLEAQRHWLALTSSSLNHLTHLPYTPCKLHRPPPPSSNTSLAVSEWYTHDSPYWGLDYPPLTAYHSLLLGTLARLSPTTARYVTLRPHSQNCTKTNHVAWENEMQRLEEEGGLRNWMRASVVVGDVVLWVSAVLVYVRRNCGGSSRDQRRGLRRMLVASMTILLQPALILIDNGHFQYNSIMLALTLHALNAFQAGHDLVGSFLFVLSLGFKQMALYYAPGVFAYLLGKCLWLGGRKGLTHLLHLSLTVLLSFTLLFLPLLTSPHPLTTLLTALTRIFPFSRGLFEDKVANLWCALNVVVKLRQLASVGTLAKLALLVTGTAVAPMVIGVAWVSHKLQHSDSTSSSPSPAASRLGPVLNPTAFPPAPISVLLPHLLLFSSLSFFLFSFQVHEKSILLPLMPLTVMMGARESGWGRGEWEWGVLVNNVGVFSMWPLLRRDGLSTQYLSLLLLWNWSIGYNPLTLRPSFLKVVSLTTYAAIFTLHLTESLTPPPIHLPDLYAVLNLTISAGVFGVVWLWCGRRLVLEGWGLVGLGK